MAGSNMELRVRLNAGVHHELFQDLESIDAGGRPERMRALALIGLALLGRSGGLNTAANADKDVPKDLQKDEVKTLSGSDALRSKAKSLRGKTKF